jgi:hypothetical protein
MDIYYQKMSFEVIHAVDRFRPLLLRTQISTETGALAYKPARRALPVGNLPPPAAPWPSPNLWINLLFHHCKSEESHEQPYPQHLKTMHF